MRRLTRSLLPALAALVLISRTVVAQDTPVVFIHGVGSSPATWADAATRLESRLEIAPQRASVSWQQSLESQGDQVQARFGNLPGSTIAVGHSLGGLVARQWSRQHQLNGLVTLGSPNRGAPIANHVNEWLGFNYSLYNAVGTGFQLLGRVSYDDWWWIYSAVQGALGWGGYIADFAINHLLIDLGMQVGAPFVQEVYVGSPYLNALNGSNLSREASQIPARIGIVNTANRYWEGGPFRLADPDYGGQLSAATVSAAAALDYWGFSVSSQADPMDSNAQALASGLWDAAFWFWNFDEFWCRTVSDDRPLWSAHCLPNDGFIPTWSQFYPGATANLESIGGPMHTEETRRFDDYLYTAMTTFMHVPPRGSTPPPGSDPSSPPPGGDPAPSPGEAADSLGPNQVLYPGESITSGDGRFSLMYQGDGNLVLYRFDGAPLWHSRTNGTSAGRVVMQSDGNLVVYNGSGGAVWASGTAGYGNSYLLMQNDGNLVIYTSAGAPVWASGTSGY